MSGFFGKQKFVVGIATFLLVIFIVLAIGFLAINYLVSLLGSKCVAEVGIDYPLTVEGMPETLFDTGYPSSEELAENIRELNSRDDVGSVIFVFNSGGGSTVASKEIYDAIKDLKKPKVAYFRETAASGAYYAATAADYIISEPYAITGSIGVVAMVVSMEGLFDKLGINATAITSGKHKDIASSFKNMDPEELDIMQNIVDEIFQDFKRIVIENRKGKLNAVRADEIFDGRVFTGKQAKELGLIDEVGSKRDAIMKAAALADIEAKKPDDVRICEIEVRKKSSNPLFGMQALFQKFTETLPSGILLKFE